jgi:hypothetical protein
MRFDIAIQASQDRLIEPNRTWSCHDYSVAACSRAVASGTKPSRS